MRNTLLRIPQSFEKIIKEESQNFDKISKANEEPKLSKLNTVQVPPNEN